MLAQKSMDIVLNCISTGKYSIPSSRYPAVFAALEQAGYRGLIGYELFPKTDTQTAVRAIMAD